MHPPRKVPGSKWLLVAAGALTACEHAKVPPPSPPPTGAEAPLRGAAGDTDVRVMIAEIASTRACEMIEGQFIGLPAADRPNVVTGVLWIRHCKIRNDGTRVSLSLSGNGWQWAEQTRHQAGGSFAVRQYVKFEIDAQLRGSIDIAYDRAAHVLSLWFSPTTTPVIVFHPIGDIEPDSQGLWSSVISGVASVLDESPGELGTQAAQRQGKQAFEAKLAGGLTFAVNLCTGHQRTTLGRAAKGLMGEAGVGQTRRVSVELEPDGLMVFGPVRAPRGMTVDIDSSDAVRVGLACVEDVTASAAAFVGDRAAPPVTMLGEADITGHGKIHIKGTSCSVAVVARPLAPFRVTFAYSRSEGEQARSVGGPIIDCPR